MAVSVLASGTNTPVLQISLGTNQIDTVNTDATVTINETGHGLAVGDAFILSGASDVGGLVVNGRWVVATVPDANSITFEHTSTASSTASGGGASAILDPQDLLTTNTTAGTYQLVVDLRNLVADEVVNLYVYTKAFSGEAETQLYSASFRAGMEQTASLPLLSPIEIRCTLEQINGTARAFPWALYTV